jgi:type I restriction enzyme, S subunit
MSRKLWRGRVVSKSFQVVRLGDFLIPVSRSETVVPEKTYHILGAHWYAKGLYTKDIKNGSQIQAKHLYRVENGDFVYNRLFAWKGSFAVASEENDGCYVSNEFPCFLVNHDRVDSGYLWRYFSRVAAWEEALGLSAGGTPTSRNRLKEDKLLAMKMPLPVLEEQRRIAGKIDELVAKIEEARRLRQQAAEEAEALPDSMMNETVKKASSKAPWELGPIPMFANINPSRTGEINLAADDPVSFVPMKAVDDVTGNISWPEVRPFREVAKGYTWFKEGDVIFARITPCMQNGKAAIARNLVSGNGFGSTEFHVIRPGPKLLAEWLHSLVRHKAFREDATKTFKGTAGQQRVPQSFLDQRVIPVPPLAEQRQIIAEIDALRGKVDELKRIQAETVAELNSLLPSILDKAFKGDL